MSNVIDIGLLLGNPVLKRITNSKYMWTGMIPHNQIDEHLIRDENARNELRNIVRDFENTLVKMRKAIDLTKSGIVGAPINFDQNFLTQKVDELDYNEKQLVKYMQLINNFISDKGIYIDWDVLTVRLANRYIEIKEKNKTEFENFPGGLELISKKYTTLEGTVSELKAKGIMLLEKIKGYCAEFLIGTYTKFENGKYSSEYVTTKELDKNFRESRQDEDVAIVQYLKLALGEESNEAIIKEGNFTDKAKKVLVDMLLPLDFEEIKELIIKSYCRENAGIINFQVVSKNYLLRNGFDQTQIDEKIDAEIEKEAGKLFALEGGKEGFLDETVDNLLENLGLTSYKYIFFELTNISLENLKNVRISNLDPKENPDLLKEIDAALALSRDVFEKAELVSKYKYKTYQETPASNNVKNEVKNFVDGVYWNDSFKEMILTRLLIDHDMIANMSDELLEKIEIPESHLEVIIQNRPDSISKLVKFGKISKEEILRIINGEKKENDPKEDKTNNSVDLELLYESYKSGIIDNNELFQFYKSQKIDIAFFGKIFNETQVQNRTELSSKVTIMDLLEQYQKIESLGKNPKEKERAIDEKNLLLEYYRKISSKEKGKDEISNEIEEMILELITNPKNKFRANVEILASMTIDGLIGMEEISELKDASSSKKENYTQAILENLFKKGELDLGRTSKIRDLLSKNFVMPSQEELKEILEIENPMEILERLLPQSLNTIVNEVLESQEIPETEKARFILNTFHRDEVDGKIAEILLAKVTGTPYYEKSRKKLKNDDENTTAIDQEKEPRKNYQARVYPKFVKWNFYEALDSQAKPVIYDNGYVEFSIPKFGVRIIEKYFEVTNSSLDFSKDPYGVSTMLIEEDEYQKNKDAFIKREGRKVKLQRERLSRIVPRRNRVNHNTKNVNANWMRGMLKRLGILENNVFTLTAKSQYSKEELEKIDETLRLYENSYIEIEK